MDTCSALTKVGSIMCICDRPKGHSGDHKDQTKNISWSEERWGGGGEHVVNT